VVRGSKFIARTCLDHSIDPLNYKVEMLRRLRALPDQASVQADGLRQVIDVTLNGIAAGLRNTG